MQSDTEYMKKIEVAVGEVKYNIGYNSTVVKGQLCCFIGNPRLI